MQDILTFELLRKMTINMLMTNVLRDPIPANVPAQIRSLALVAGYELAPAISEGTCAARFILYKMNQACPQYSYLPKWNLLASEVKMSVIHV